MNQRSTLICLPLLLLLAQISLVGQSDKMIDQNPTFENFTGTVYDMPNIRQKIGKVVINAIQEHYSDTVYHYPPIQSISLDEINIESIETATRGFPGIAQKSKFAMVLHSNMQIAKDACYEFQLSSDDGSRLWIDELDVIDNDGGHKMKTKTDTIHLTKGMHKVKLWYFQGYPTRCGFIFDSRILPNDNSCRVIDREVEEKQIMVSKRVINSVLFETDKFELTELGKAEIRDVAAYVNIINAAKISIVGHTDATGSTEYNFDLSLERANAVMNQLRKHVKDTSIEYITIGKGASEALDVAETAAGRQLNRRVEILIQ